MGEAKRKARRAAARPWLIGSIEVEANDELCFDWKGTRADAIQLQKDYLRQVERFAIVGAQSYAARAAGYLMAFGMPKAGDPDQRPSSVGQTWSQEEIELYKAGILWMALREHVPDQPGKRLEDVFPGQALQVILRGDRRDILAATLEELNGQPFGAGAYTMMVAVLGDLPLDPGQAVTMLYRDLQAMAGYPPLEADSRFAHDIAYLPRLPIDADDARALLQFTTIFVDVTDPGADPESAFKTYVGYSENELRRGKPAVIVGRNDE